MACVVYSQENQGFFLNDRKEKSVALPPSVRQKEIKKKATVEISISENIAAEKISEYLYGNNANQWMGQIVAETKLMKQINILSPGIIRYPGGNYSNIFFWNAEPGKIPADVPDTILYGDSRLPRKSRFSFGKDNGPRCFSLENYYKLLQQTNSIGTICVNAGYARYGMSDNPIATAAHYAADWVRYDNGRTQFWEVGNEDFGEWQAGYKIDVTKNKDGQPVITNGELYGKIFKAFSDSMKQAAKEINTLIYIGAVLVEAKKDKPHDKEVEKNWNSGFFKIAANSADFFVVHSYYTPYEKNSPADLILKTATAVTRDMMSYLHQMCIDNNVIMKPVALTEWNIFAIRSKQQTSFINGMHAALVLGEMAKQKFWMACRWDLANSYSNGDDHGLFNRGDEPGMPLWSARPAFYYLYYFKKYFGERMIDASSDDSSVKVYASSFSNGKKGLVVINKTKVEKTASIEFTRPLKKTNAYCYTLTGGTDNGEFSQKVIINGIEPSLPAGGPEDFENINAWCFSFRDKLKIVLPARSVQYILID